MKSTTDTLPTRLYPVCEIFYSLQGEGYFTGTPALFVRFSGCNRRCSFCDTDFSASRSMTAAEIVHALRCAGSARHLVLTGGEPAMWIDEPLLSMLKEEDYYIQIETNGSLPVSDTVDWVTCSPKAEPWEIGRINELKIVFQGDGAFVEAARKRFAAPHCFLQPCSGLNTSETIDYILTHPWWRLSLQTHKFLSIR